MNHNQVLYPQYNGNRFLVPFLLGAAIAYPFYSLKGNCGGQGCYYNPYYMQPYGYYPFGNPPINNYSYYNNYPLYRNDEGYRFLNLSPLFSNYNFLNKKWFQGILPFNPLYCVDSPYCYYHGNPYYQNLFN